MITRFNIDMSKVIVRVAPTEPDEVLSAVCAAPAEIERNERTATALIWTSGSPISIEDFITDEITWVQLPTVGVENWKDQVHGHRVWTCARTAYSAFVAEHALALLLAGVHRLAPRRSDHWKPYDFLALDRQSVCVWRW